MAQDYYEIVIRLVAALLAGGLIGLERSHRGRPAGFRTHALVCLASSLQGIMTGIGFLGAGAIIKEGAAPGCPSSRGHCGATRKSSSTGSPRRANRTC